MWDLGALAKTGTNSKIWGPDGASRQVLSALSQRMPPGHSWPSGPYLPCSLASPLTFSPRSSASEKRGHESHM